MPYITKKTPTARSTDTALGKVMGYLAELLEYLKWENFALTIDAVFPDWFPLGTVQGILIDVCRGVYNRIYQSAYNQGADKGNEINKQIMGWLDSLRNQAFARVDEAKAYIQNNLINPIKSQIDNNITPRLNDAISKISTINNQISAFNTQLTTFGNRLSGMDSTISDFRNRVDALDKVITNLNTKASQLDTALKDAQSKLSQYKSMIDDLNRRVKALEGKREEIFPLLKL